ncbi:UNVERIFIED_CONTAM: hypothetical protein Sradi_6664400 [Sesamum radiatum]|uniref:Uncharacterized protein n=1 Tax=Sesamum radiatum TaxID=300843 RepID=A0AAW2JR83_SESRA
MAQHHLLPTLTPDTSTLTSSSIAQYSHVLSSNPRPAQAQENQTGNIEETHMQTENRSNLLTLGQFEFVVQPFHVLPHLFINPSPAPKVVVEASQEREPSARDRELQFRLLVIPTAQQNGHANMGNVMQNGRQLMKVLSWNSRGVSRPDFMAAARLLIARHNPQVFVVLDTRIQEERAQPVIRRLEFDSSAVASPLGLSGGIWVLWKSDMVDLNRLHLSTHTIHLEVIMRN